MAELTLNYKATEESRELFFYIYSTGKIYKRTTTPIILNLAKKYDIETEIMLSRDPSEVADHNGKEFKYLQKCIEEAIPDVVPIPYLMTGGTDCRQFEIVSDNCLRFTPTRLTPEQLAAMHAANESIGVSDSIFSMFSDLFNSELFLNVASYVLSFSYFYFTITFPRVRRNDSTRNFLFCK